MELQHGWFAVNVSGGQSKLSGTALYHPAPILYPLPYTLPYILPLYHPPPILDPHRTLRIKVQRIHFFVLF